MQVQKERKRFNIAISSIALLGITTLLVCATILMGVSHIQSVKIESGIFITYMLTFLLFLPKIKKSIPSSFNIAVYTLYPLLLITGFVIFTIYSASNQSAAFVKRAMDIFKTLTGNIFHDDLPLVMEFRNELTTISIWKIIVCLVVFSFGAWKLYQRIRLRKRLNISNDQELIFSYLDRSEESDRYESLAYNTILLCLYHEDLRKKAFLSIFEKHQSGIEPSRAGYSYEMIRSLNSYLESITASKTTISFDVLYYEYRKKFMTEGNSTVQKAIFTRSLDLKKNTLISKLRSFYYCDIISRSYTEQYGGMMAAIIEGLYATYNIEFSHDAIANKLRILKSLKHRDICAYLINVFKAYNDDAVFRKYRMNLEKSLSSSRLETYKLQNRTELGSFWSKLLEDTADSIPIADFLSTELNQHNNALFLICKCVEAEVINKIFVPFRNMIVSNNIGMNAQSSSNANNFIIGSEEKLIKYVRGKISITLGDAMRIMTNSRKANQSTPVLVEFNKYLEMRCEQKGIDIRTLVDIIENTKRYGVEYSIWDIRNKTAHPSESRFTAETYIKIKELLCSPPVALLKKISEL